MDNTRKSFKATQQRHNLDVLVKSLFQDEYLLKGSGSRPPKFSSSIPLSTSHPPSNRRFWDVVVKCAAEDKEMPFI
ncbi:hypothetical protein PRIPAC_70713 [Pristionchus pacificus]|uniref:Uncharacterized protein n=1 Tax=Pristionchus pacificus TaxID=54126 RepID=A0A454XM43_PRIPA|nr:hypothetical protein PRIPAC_70713 [Pristionchus pacificus]|eukprot:PDM64879.1 hypothetical protein PRIPAC_53135 [Pristionchus pacificus]